MAKKKLTLEDMLVPVDEIPYEVPENWCWVKFEHLVKDTKLGLVRSVKQQSIDYEYNYLKMNNITNSGEIDLNGIVNVNADRDEIEVYSLKKGDFLFNTRNSKELVGKNTVVKEDFQDIMLFNNNIMRVRFHEGINPQIVSSYLNSPMGQRKLDEIKRVTTNIAAIYAKDLNKILIPIPPLAEQERIVNRIESLFDKVDRAAELVDEARDGFEKRRAAILEMAFSGELTKCDSINDNEIDLSTLSKDIVDFDIPCEIPNNWKWLKFNECCTFLGSGVTPKGGSSVYSEKGTPFIRSQNVLKGSLDMSDVVYISDEIQEKMKRTTVYSKDTLLNITGASIGRCAYVPNDIEEANVNQHVCILRFKEYIDYKYPSYWINSPIFQNIINKEQIGATRQALNFKQLRGMWIPVPHIDEQRKIVDILDRLMEKEKEISELSDMDYNIESIKKSILAKAFRGELGSNDLNEESSTELLKQLIK